MRFFTSLSVIFLFCILSISLTGYSQISFTSSGGLIPDAGSSGAPGCVIDMNNDQLDDIVRLWGSQLVIDYQNSDGTFTHADLLNTGSSGLWSICAADIDGNGYNDLLLGDGNHVEFLYANETGTNFTSDLKPEYIFSQRSTFADIDNDGNLDAFVCHDVDQSHPYRNDGTGALNLDQSLINTIDLPGNYSAIWTDYDNDEDLDLYITKCRGGAVPGDPARTNGLYQNNGDGTFSEVGISANMADNAQSWTTVFEDFDNDGDFDAFIVNHDFANRFMDNNGDGTFTDIIGTTAINAGDLGAWEAGAGDFDNDGWIDIISEVGGGIYRNNGDGTFSDISIPFDEGGIGDLNNDGFLDMYSGSSIYLNDGNDNNWVKFHLQGIISNYNGIGARLEIYGDWGKQIREVRAGESFSPMSSLTAHFGIGTSTDIDSVVIKWPSGFYQSISNPLSNTTHIILEADCLLPETTIATSTDTEICPGETVELTAEPGYEYAWSNGLTTQSITVGDAGNYKCILTDPEGCISVSEIISVVVILDDTPVITLNGPEIFCEGESVTLISSEAISYSWSNGSVDQSIEVSQSGTFSVETEGQCETLSSDFVEIEVKDAADEPIANGVVLGEPASVDLTATGENIQWYEEIGSTEVLAEGPDFTTPVLSEPTTYYVDAHMVYGGEQQDGGKPDNSGGGGLPSTGAYNYFDVWEPFTLESVRVYPVGDGERTIQLVDGSGAVLDELTMMLFDGEMEVELNFEVPVGTDLTLRLDNSNLFRNNDGVSYPYAIGTVGEITTSFYGNQYYYYFYDWKIKLEEFKCFSDRVSVTVDFQTGLNDLLSVSEVSLYPNPASEFVNIDMEIVQGGTYNFNLISNTGQLIWSETSVSLSTGNQQKSIDVSTLASGIYQLNVVEDHSGESATLKIVVQH